MLSLLSAISGSGTSPFSSGSLSWLIAVLRLWVMFWIALALAIVVWTFKDARRRIENPVIVAVCVASAAIFPFIGALIYLIVRPPESLTHVRERDLDIRVIERGLGGHR
jgi:predicted PurR-regulated permease PerM